MKYIIFRYQTGIETPVLFSSLVEHRSITPPVHHLFGEPVAVAAGFYEGERAGGHSVGLKLESRAQDWEIIQNAIREMI